METISIQKKLTIEPTEEGTYSEVLFNVPFPAGRLHVSYRINTKDCVIDLGVKGLIV
ncbi:hypothetical protein [Bacillus sp. JCM 19034]|uniref:hypothetical protein n=1 Tax=Bacillus sp. JCM 19034 TaxID=1481928 RepID=UPI000B0F4320|nr:hypothetical protein [Bacillus sp. JCM 19034]